MEKLHCSTHGWVETNKSEGKRCSLPLGDGKYCAKTLRASESEARGGRRHNSGRYHLDGTRAGDAPNRETVTLDVSIPPTKAAGKRVRESLHLLAEVGAVSPIESDTTRVVLYLTAAQKQAILDTAQWLDATASEVVAELLTRV